MHMPFTPNREQLRVGPGATLLHSEQDSVHLAQDERSQLPDSVVPAHFSQWAMRNPPAGNDAHNMPAADGLQ